MFNFFDNLKAYISEVVKSRLFVMIIAFCLMAAILIQRVFYLQIVQGDEYLDNYKLKIQKTKEVQGTRGNIYDRNGELLAYNELAYSVTIEDNGSYSDSEEKNNYLNSSITEIIKIVEGNDDTIINDFGIILNDNGDFEFLEEEGTRRLRFLADIYGKRKIDELKKEQKASSPQDVINYLCEGARKDGSRGFYLDQKKYDKDLLLKLITIRYAMSLNSFSKYIATTIAYDVSDETVAAIMENLDKFQGVNIAEDSLRRYVDSEYFAPILGYTGKISLDEYNAFEKEGKKNYALTDIVGKAGLEQTMDEVLQGKRGKEKVYVDNVGRIMDTVKIRDASAGNNLYLSIDKNLQEAVYHIVEEKLAGILLDKMRNVMNYDRNQVSDEKEIIIPADDVYNAFFANEILDVTHFTEKDAKAAEKEIQASFEKQKKSALDKVSKELKSNSAKAYKDLTKEMQAYMIYIANDILKTKTGILMKDKIDTNDKTYKAWKEDESISLREYLNYAISQNWIDTAKLQDYVSSDGKYSDSKELYNAILAYLEDHLKDDRGFDKLIYRYSIKTGAVTGRQICLALYEQNVLKYDENQYNRLASGSLGAYDFIRGKIETLEITPGQLGLEPCTGSAIVTDTNTGKVLACVSYPGYDSNRLANTMDSKYYNKLVTDLSSPFYNSVTQEKTAPGSTYKIVSSVAGLTEGEINASTIINCSGPFEKVTPSPKCWAYPNAHGNLNVVGGIQHSCNNFFYEVGYRLSTDGDKYSTTKGLDKLKKYASMFGLNEKSGLEIPEASPQISNEDPVRSAIGQGTNNYTVSQINRYITAVANKGDLYNLSLLDHVEDNDGKTVKKYKPDKERELKDVSDSTWSLVHQGMQAVVANNANFESLRALNFQMSGKTGTAQQSKTHPNHGLFVGFAPSVNPEISLTVRIANGYSSTYAAEIGRDIVKYHFNLVEPGEIIHGRASSISSSTSGD